MKVWPRSKSEVPVIAEGLFSYQIGGSERVGVDLAVEFRRRGYQVICFAFYDSDGPMRQELESAGVRCLEMNYENLKGMTRRLVYQWKFWRMLRKERVSALHVHHATALILCGVPAAVASTRSVIMTEHGLYQLKERADYRRTAARYCRFASGITVVEPTQIDYFRDEMHVDARRLHYVRNGVRVPRRTQEKTSWMRAQLSIPDGAFAFFYVGRLSEVKDLPNLLRAFSLLDQEVCGRTILYLAGDGPERKSLEDLAKTLGVGGRVSFLGARHDISELLLAADAFVMSSRTEGLPMALLEAMAAQVPCVATQVGGIPELLSDGRGLLVPPGNAAELAEKMKRICRSPALRAEIVSNAYQNIQKHYALDTVAERYLSLLGLPAFAEGAREQLRP